MSFAEQTRCSQASDRDTTPRPWRRVLQSDEESLCRVELCDVFWEVAMTVQVIVEEFILLQGKKKSRTRRRAESRSRAEEGSRAQGTTLDRPSSLRRQALLLVRVPNQREQQMWMK